MAAAGHPALDRAASVHSLAESSSPRHQRAATVQALDGRDAGSDSDGGRGGPLATTLPARTGCFDSDEAVEKAADKVCAGRWSTGGPVARWPVALRLRVVDWLRAASS